MQSFMLFINLKLTKNKVFRLAAVLLVALLVVIGILCNFKAKQISGQDALSREAYLNSLGYSLEKGSEEKTLITIPEDFSKTYAEYNKKQISSGFNLSDYKGCDATVYTYLLSNFETRDGVWANLIVIDGKIVGGDISTTENGGFILPLKTYEENQKILKTYVTTT